MASDAANNLPSWQTQQYSSSADDPHQEDTSLAPDEDDHLSSKRLSKETMARARFPPRQKRGECNFVDDVVTTPNNLLGSGVSYIRDATSCEKYSAAADASPPSRRCSTLGSSGMPKPKHRRQTQPKGTVQYCTTTGMDFLVFGCSPLRSQNSTRNQNWFQSTSREKYESYSSKKHNIGKSWRGHDAVIDLSPHRLRIEDKRLGIACSISFACRLIHLAFERSVSRARMGRA